MRQSHPRRGKSAASKLQYPYCDYVTADSVATSLPPPRSPNPRSPSILHQKPIDAIKLSWAWQGLRAPNFKVLKTKSYHAPTPTPTGSSQYWAILGKSHRSCKKIQTDRRCCDCRGGLASLSPLSTADRLLTVTFRTQMPPGWKG